MRGEAALQAHRLHHLTAQAASRRPPALSQEGVDPSDSLAHGGALELERRPQLSALGAPGRVKGELVEVLNVIGHPELLSLQAVW